MYNLETERVAEEIRHRGAKRVLLQLPDGFRPMAFDLAKSLSELTDSEILLYGSSCYGACDLPINQARTLEVDLIVHYGHSKQLHGIKEPIIYVESRMDYDPKAIAKKVFPLLKSWQRVGLTATVQHAHLLGEVANELELDGIQAILGDNSGGTSYRGQILGCDYTTALSISNKVNGYLFVGAGRFHPLGLALSTGKPIVIVNPYNTSVSELDNNELIKLAKKRMAAITLAKKAQRFGVIVSLKPGQNHMQVAKSMMKELRNMGKEAFIIILDEVNSSSLGNFSDIEAYINTACPRISLDGVALFRKPILTTKEARVALGKLLWKDLWGKNYFAGAGGP